MADNVAVTAGSGTSIATDDVSGVHYQKVKIDIGGNGASVPLDGGQEAKTASMPVVLATEQEALIGPLTETAPANDTASSGLNGRLQRIAQNITTLIGSVLHVIVDSGSVVLGAGTNAIGKLSANSGVDIGDVDVTSLPSLPAGTNNIGDVDVLSMPTGSSAAQVQGTVASGSAAANNPVHVGGKAKDSISGAVDADDVASQMVDLYGRPVVAIEAPNGALTAGYTSTITDTTATEVLAAAGISKKWRITAIGVYNSDATVGTWVKIQDDSSPSPVVYWRGYCAANGGGFNLNFSPAIPAKGQGNGKINVVCETTSAEVSANVVAYQVPS